MMAKRGFTFAGVLVVCVALVLAFLAPRHGVTRANYDRIERGMTLSEVQELFGKEGTIFHGYPNKAEIAYCWENEDRSFAILFFDDSGKVVERAKWGYSTESIAAFHRYLRARS